MTSNHTNNNNNWVSALNSTLKLLKDMYFRFMRCLGHILIDNLMRKVLVWYDKRYPNSSNLKRGYQSQEVNRLQIQIQTLNEEVLHLKESNSICASKRKSLSDKISILEKEIGHRDVEFNLLNAEKNSLVHQIESLNNEKGLLSKRCLPETEIPSMTYYAQGDTAGEWLRKVSTTKSPQHIYKVLTLPGDASSADFHPEVESNIQDIISNRGLTLSACEIIGIAPNASSIIVVESGRAMHENNKWKIIKKSKIQLQ